VKKDRLWNTYRSTNPNLPNMGPRTRYPDGPEGSPSVIILKNPKWTGGDCTFEPGNLEVNDQIEE
jgi:hypothetical protein